MKIQALFLAAAVACSTLAAPVFADPSADPSAEAAAAAPTVTLAADADTTAPAPASDSELAKRVKAAISSNGTTHGLPIQVAVTEGVVRLTGTVPSGVQVDQAEYVASTVPGVREVNNKLRPKHDS